MRNTIILVLFSLIVTSLVGCSGSSASKQDQGVFAGGVIGGLVGSRFGNGSGQVLATAAGAVVGAMIGGTVGKNMDKTDRLEMNQALEYSHTNKTKRWTNPDSGVHYAVTPTKTFYQRDTLGTTQPCREFTTSAVIGGKSEKVYGTACRHDDGRWQILNRA